MVFKVVRINLLMNLVRKDENVKIIGQGLALLGGQEYNVYILRSGWIKKLIKRHARLGC